MPACVPVPGRHAGRVSAPWRAISSNLRSQIAASGAVGVVAPDGLAAYRRTRRPGQRPARRLDGVVRRPAGIGGRLRPLSGGERCYIQFSSGSTRLPLGVDIRQDQLMANIDGSLASQEVVRTIPP